MTRFEQESLFQIHRSLSDRAKSLVPGDTITFCAPDPAGAPGAFSGEFVMVHGIKARYRSYRTWTDLAETLGCRLLRVLPTTDAAGFVDLTFQKLDDAKSFHDDPVADVTEKYGTSTRYGRIDKLEEPTFLIGLTNALAQLDLPDRARILDLGVNKGDELEALRLVVGDRRFEQFEIVAVDHSSSAILAAKTRFTSPSHRFLTHDINDLASLELGRFHVILSIGTLHSPGIANGKTLLMQLVQDHLERAASVVLGFPNCRWTDGEVVYGSKTRNYSEPELSLLLKDVDFAKRYLQRKFRVNLSGKHTIFLTARRVA